MECQYVMAETLGTLDEEQTHESAMLRVNHRKESNRRKEKCQNPSAGCQNVREVVHDELDGRDAAEFTVLGHPDINCHQKTSAVNEIDDQVDKV